MRYLIIFFLLFSTNANAKKIQLTNCYNENTNFDTSKFEERKFVIDEERNVISFVIVYQDAYLKKEKEAMKKAYGAKAAADLRKISTRSYPIKYFGDEYVEAIKKGREGRDDGYVVNLKKKSVESISSFFSFTTNWQCK